MAKNAITFMNDALKNPGLKGKFLDALYSTPPPSDGRLQKWFKSKGYSVSKADCKKIKKLVKDTETIPIPHY